MISFCTVCCDRVENLKKTYLNNLKACNGHEFILLNYGDKTYLDEYVRESLLESFDSLVYYHTDVKYYHMSKAWNLVSRLATGEFIFFLTPDVIVKKDIIDVCKKALKENLYICDPSMNTVFEGHGLEDVDMTLRCRNAGINSLNPGSAIKVLDHPDALRHGRYKQGDQNEWLLDKQKKIAFNKRFKIVMANNKGFAKHVVIKNFGGEII